MAKAWPLENTVPPEELVAHYRADHSWDTARYWYETWRKTTALIDPPVSWDSLDQRMQLAMCAVADGVAKDASERN